MASELSPLKGSNQESGCHIPFVPASCGSFLLNRAVSFLKVVVSGVTFVVSGVTLIALGCGDYSDRLRRCALAFGSILQGTRQFLYTADCEESSMKNTSGLDRARVVLQIGNLPATGGRVEDLRNGMLLSKNIEQVFIRTIYPQYNRPKLVADAQGAPIEKYDARQIT